MNAKRILPLSRLEREVAALKADAVVLLAGTRPMPSPATVERIRLEADRIIAAVSLWGRSEPRAASGLARAKAAARAASIIRVAALAVMPRVKAAAALAALGTVTLANPF